MYVMLIMDVGYPYSRVLLPPVERLEYRYDVVLKYDVSCDGRSCSAEAHNPNAGQRRDIFDLSFHWYCSTAIGTIQASAPRCDGCGRLHSALSALAIARVNDEEHGCAGHRIGQSLASGGDARAPIGRRRLVPRWQGGADGADARGNNVGTGTGWRAGNEQAFPPDSGPGRFHRSDRPFVLRSLGSITWFNALLVHRQR